MNYTNTAKDIPTIRLLSQQLASPQFRQVEEVVDWMGMLQAQEYRMMRWAAAMRTSEPSLASFKKAYDSGLIVRTHLFRGTWQLVTSKDLMWMLSLCKERNRKLLKGYLSLAKQDISEAQYEHFNDLINNLLADKISIRKDELLQILKDKGVQDDPYIISVYLLRAEFDGIICSGHLDDNRITYGLIKNRIQHPQTFEHEEALALLAKKYFRSHSPASLKDFVWWTNLTVKDCRQAITAIQNELTVIDINEEKYYVHQDCRTLANINKMMLLPSYDEYLIGYKSRHFVLKKEYLSRAYSSNGIFHPVIARSGNIVGNWHPRKATPSFFEKEWEKEFYKALEVYHHFLKH